MNNTSGATSSSKSVSLAAAFRHPVFAVIWTATLVSNVGGWMYSAASGWLMTSFNPDPLVVALVQTATTLPVFLFAIPAGALADIFDKRKFLIVFEILNTALCVVYAAMVGLGLATPNNLLLFTFLIGAAAALTLPAWQAIVPQLVPKEDLTLRCCGQQRRRERLARNRSGPWRRGNRRPWHRLAVLDQRNLQSRSARRIVMVAAELV